LTKPLLSGSIGPVISLVGLMYIGSDIQPHLVILSLWFILFIAKISVLLSAYCHCYLVYNVTW